MMMNKFDDIIAKKLAEADYPVDYALWDAVRADLPVSASASPNFLTPLLSGVAAVSIMVFTLSNLPNLGGAPNHESIPAADLQVEVAPQYNQASQLTTVVHTPQSEHEIQLEPSTTPQDAKQAAVLVNQKDAQGTQNRPELPPDAEPSLEESVESIDAISFKATGIQCPGRSVKFEIHSSYDRQAKWLIDGVHVLEGSNVHYAFAEPGLHEVTLLLDLGDRTLSETRTIEIFEQPKLQTHVSVGADMTCFRQVIYVAAEPGVNSYTWKLAEGDVRGAELETYLEEGLHQLTLEAVNAHGCLQQEEVLVNVNEAMRLYIPNSFSPDGDGTNDEWMIPGLDRCSTVRVMVYRLKDNALVFEASDGSGWDGSIKGTTERPGLREQFVYHVIATDECGFSKEYKGTIVAY
jgi:gliding motility-associated-like protein